MSPTWCRIEEYKRLEGERPRKPSFITKTFHSHLNSKSLLFRLIDLSPKTSLHLTSLSQPYSFLQILLSDCSVSFPKSLFVSLSCTRFVFVCVESFCVIQHLGFWKREIFLVWKWRNREESPLGLRRNRLRILGFVSSSMTFWFFVKF